jgi:hypothetical protein
MRCPCATPDSSSVPRSLGPRCVIESVIASSTSADTGAVSPGVDHSADAAHGYDPGSSRGVCAHGEAEHVDLDRRVAARTEPPTERSEVLVPPSRSAR